MVASNVRLFSSEFLHFVFFCKQRLFQLLCSWKNTAVSGGMMMLFGVDLSHWQGEVDFAKLYSAGVRFCFLKFSEGTTHVDDRALGYLQSACAQGIPAGAYHYFLPKYDPIQQAEHFERTMTAFEAQADTLMLPPVLDVEVKATTAVLKKSILAFLKHVEQCRGVTPMLYTSPGFWRSYVGRWDEIVHFPLWVAHYGTTFPSQFYPWARWNFWQYSSAGRVLGCTTSIDLDLFPGTSEDLLQLCTSMVQE
jgi:lysozyme